MLKELRPTVIPEQKPPAIERTVSEEMYMRLKGRYTKIKDCLAADIDATRYFSLSFYLFISYYASYW